MNLLKTLFAALATVTVAQAVSTDKSPSEILNEFKKKNAIYIQASVEYQSLEGSVFSTYVGAEDRYSKECNSYQEAFKAAAEDKESTFILVLLNAPGYEKDGNKIKKNVDILLELIKKTNKKKPVILMPRLNPEDYADRMFDRAEATCIRPVWFTEKLRASKGLWTTNKHKTPISLVGNYRHENFEEAIYMTVFETIKLLQNAGVSVSPEVQALIDAQNNPTPEMRAAVVDFYFKSF